MTLHFTILCFGDSVRRIMKYAQSVQKGLGAMILARK
jgi:hypothetical protein